MIDVISSNWQEGKILLSHFGIVLGVLAAGWLLVTLWLRSRRKAHQQRQMEAVKNRMRKLDEEVRKRDQWIAEVKKNEEAYNQQRQQALSEVGRLREIVQALTNRMESDRGEHGVELERLKRVEQALREQLQQAAETRGSLEQTVATRETEIGSLKDREKEFSGKLEQAAEEYVDLKTQYQATDARMQRIAKAQGRIWETPVLGGIPEFRRLDADSARIICIMNLKGGVGKSTITANLGATLWKQGKKVLLIDLDFQGSLTSLCLSGNQIQNLRQDGRFVQSIFQDKAANLGRLRGCAERIDPCGYLMGADEDLAEYEERLMALWLIGEMGDVRFRLRELLHDQRLQREFDYVLIDCPPRRTTASVNAIAASDFIMIPVVLDSTSIEAAPRLLRNLLHLKHDTQLCPQLSVLGILANMTQKSGGLTAGEKDRWNRLQVMAQDRWGKPVYHFENAVPNRADFGHAAERNQFAVNYNEQIIGGVFRNLAQEVEWRISAYAGNGASVLS